MYFQQINAIPATSEQAAIMNVGTKWATSLALMSALKYADMPVLLIDCEAGDGNLAHFTNLIQHYHFDLLSAPLQNHGYTLDWLVEHIPAQHIL